MAINVEEEKEPFRTWYWRRAVTMFVSLLAARPDGEARNLMKAPLEGARIVIGEMEVRAEASAGWEFRRAGFSC